MEPDKLSVLSVCIILDKWFTAVVNRQECLSSTLCNKTVGIIRMRPTHKVQPNISRPVVGK